MEKTANKKQDIRRCPECGGSLISIEETGEVVCGQCGLVFSERAIDYAHSGRRSYSKEEKKKRKRTGSPISNLLPDMAFTTTINRSKIKNPDLKRATKWNSRMTWDKRNMLIATTELKRIATNLNLPPHVKQEAMRIYRQAFKNKLLRGRSINGMVAASLYYAIRKKKIPRTFQEVIEESSESPRNVRKCYSIIIKELKLHVPTTNPSFLIPRYVSELGLGTEAEKIAREIIQKYFSRFRTSGKDPKGFVAGALYIACKILDIHITQKKISDLVGVTEVTLRSRYKNLTKKLNIPS
ncbi:MAG: TFIIB-type zinc ribbon-containing protein [Promethearchaeia archaeon]